ncbi:MAG: alpha-galactosidase, partial [Chitinophagaceae bacterium]
MRRPFATLILLSLFANFCAVAQNAPIVVETSQTALVFTVKKNGRLYQAYFGEKLRQPKEYATLPDSRNEAYIAAGMDDSFEPAIQVQHADKNPSLELLYQKQEVKKLDQNATQTSILLRDKVYPVDVILHFVSYAKENVIKAWTEIRHREKGTIILYNYASSLLHFNAQDYWLTQFHGDWAKEAGMEETKLTSGSKVIDSKLGTRADKYQSPMFVLSLNNPAEENTGNVIAGTLAWTGNFKFHFEIDQLNSLRVLSGINSYASAYTLKSDSSFITPAFIFTYSANGKGEASRNLHRWARAYGVMDGKLPR